MGRTVPSFRVLLEDIILDLAVFRRALRLDFASLFPNIMVNHNISPETVLCGYCRDSRQRVPFTGYNIEEYESITAYGREILLQTIDLAEKMGFEILHGGVMTNGKLKVRGIEMRRSDTPALIIRMQEEMLDILRKYSGRVLAGECRIEDMILTARISRSINDYRQSNSNTAAIRQFQKEGITICPGQNVRYVLTDHTSKNYMKRVKIADYEFLLRAAESILLPFGYTKDMFEFPVLAKTYGQLLLFTSRVHL